MKTYRQKSRGGTNASIGGTAPVSVTNPGKGPDEEKIKVSNLFFTRAFPENQPIRPSNNG